ncbi:MAG: hypothetical protein EOO62_24955, partial [Hymenobacter sp.]
LAIGLHGQRSNGAIEAGACGAEVGIEGTGLDGPVTSLAVQPDGKVVIGGSFTSYNGTQRNFLTRLNADGSLDPGFVLTGFGITSNVYTIALQADGKVLVGGGFVYSYNGTTRSYLVRLNTDGSLDTGFTLAGTGLNGFVSSLAVQADGQVLVGGYFTTYNNVACPYVVRLNPDGTRDLNFSTTSAGLGSVGGAGRANSIAVQNGKIVVGMSGNTTNYVARLNMNGSLDPGFVLASTGFNNYLLGVAPQLDGKVLVYGAFTTYNGTARNRIARLTATGGLDDTDTPATGATYAWAPGGTTTASITVTPSATTTYTATATLAGATASVSSVVTVNPPPVAVPGAAATICAGGTAQLGAAAVLGLTYSWTPATGLNNATAANPIASPSATTTYFLTVRNSTTGCTSAGAVTVTVNPAPTITSVTPSSGPVGTQVMIYGTGLQTGVAVLFGGVSSATTPVYNGQYLLATVPAGTTTSTNFISTPCGIIPFNFTVLKTLVVNSPTTPTTIQSGTYTSIIIAN